MKISLIVAMARNYAIGLNGQMPWHLPADLKHFRAITMGHPIIMGRKTFAAIGKPLPGRRNLVISHNPDFKAEGAEVFNQIDSALAQCADLEQVFIIGGASLYEAMLARADFLYLTEIDKDFEGDTFFPQFDRQDWQELDRQDFCDPGAGFNYSFITLAKRI
ncbi:MAG: dihydrofolate reductase [Methylococcaceae bacterium]|jgi:dihydrofolate reductase|nr:dihydrofolate reductase [Methylococcaceae bacterium]